MTCQEQALYAALRALYDAVPMHVIFPGGTLHEAMIMAEDALDSFKYEGGEVMPEAATPSRSK